MENTSRRLVSLQCLRGIAALMVVVHHVLHQTPGFLSVWTTNAWQAGVDLFFVISGFVMVYVTNNRERSPVRFLAMRAARIVPIYWFYTLAAAGLILILPSLFRSNEASIKHVALSMLFVPHETRDHDLSPLVKQGWTLNYEVFFYLLFALAMWISFRRRISVSVTTLVVFAGIGMWIRLTGTSIGVAGFYFQDIILEFAFGMLIAHAFVSGKLDSIPRLIGGIAVLTGFVSIFALDSYATTARSLAYGLPAAIIIIGALAVEANISALRMPFLQFVGDSSYSIYLVHIFPIAVLRAMWPRLGLPMHGVAGLALFLLTSVTLVVALGAISYYTIERKSLRWLRVAIERRGRDDDAAN